eukprot:scaffold55166_cov30-Tisochrysis_lutea.AAC.8
MPRDLWVVRFTPCYPARRASISLIACARSTFADVKAVKRAQWRGCCSESLDVGPPSLHAEAAP